MHIKPWLRGCKVFSDILAKGFRQHIASVPTEPLLCVTERILESFSLGIKDVDMLTMQHTAQV